MTSVLLGVVSHPRSRYASSQGPDGLGAMLQEALIARGISTAIMISTDNRFDAAGTPLSSADVRASHRKMLHVQRQWRAFLARGRRPSAPTSIRQSLAYAYWRLHTEVRDVRPWQRRLPHGDPSIRAIRRLLNIELAHLAIMEAAVTGDFEWCLILEDDALVTHVDDAADGIAHIIQDSAFQPFLVNLSESHSMNKLGIEDVVVDRGFRWLGKEQRTVLAGEVPVTNTVCAMLYRTDFLRSMLVRWKDLPLLPTVPIDWKLNEVLMTMHDRGELRPYGTWIVSPAPFIQQSIHGAAVT